MHIRVLAAIDVGGNFSSRKQKSGAFHLAAAVNTDQHLTARCIQFQQIACGFLIDFPVNRSSRSCAGIAGLYGRTNVAVSGGRAIHSICHESRMHIRILSAVDIRGQTLSDADPRTARESSSLIELNYHRSLRRLQVQHVRCSTRNRRPRNSCRCHGKRLRSRTGHRADQAGCERRRKCAEFHLSLHDNPPVYPSQFVQIMLFYHILRQAWQC